jgi:hypothetical protein
MPTFSEDPIETQTRWNEILETCDCCGMPEHPVPTLEGRVVTGAALIAYLVGPVSGTYYRRRRYDWADGGFEQTDETAPYILDLDGVRIQDYNQVFTEGFPKTGASTGPTDTEPADIAAQTTAAMAAMEAALDWDTMGSAGTEASRVYGAPPYPLDGMLFVVFARIRFTVPDTHTGTYFRILWDWLDTPETGSPAISTADEEWIWTGPGDPEDPDSWKSPWFEIPLPTSSAARRPVNIRYWSYDGGPFGVLPDYLGERFPA